MPACPARRVRSGCRASCAVAACLVLLLAVGALPRAARAAPFSPAPGTSWQWQLSGAPDLSVDAAVYDVDGFLTDAGTVAALHARGRRAVCYLNAGAYEDFRPDAATFPAAVLGKELVQRGVDRSVVYWAA